MAGIEEMVYFLPENRVPIKSLAKEMNLSIADLYLHTKFHGQNLICRDPDLNLMQLLEKSLDQLFDISNVSNYKITHLIYTHVINFNQDFTYPILDALLKKYKLKNCSAMALTQANCASGLMALRMANTILAAGRDDEAVLVLCGDKVFGPFGREPGCTINGDGSAAMLITRQSEKNKILGTNLKIDGRYHMGLSDPQVLEKFVLDNNDIWKDFLFGSLERAGVELSEMKYVINHNINSSFWLQLAKYLGWDNSLLYLDNIPYTGHCFSADNFINFAMAIEKKQVEPGDKCILAANGAGFYYSSAIIKH